MAVSSDAVLHARSDVVPVSRRTAAERAADALRSLAPLRTPLVQTGRYHLMALRKQSPSISSLDATCI